MANYDGGAGDDVFIGQLDGINTMFGEGGNDWLQGGPYDDVLYGDDGNDTLMGAAGNDVFRPGAGDDVVAGGDGIDFILIPSWTINGPVYFDAPAGVMTSELGNDTISSIEALGATMYSDTLIGDGAPNRFLGEDGNDMLDGNGGDDSIEGGPGADTLRGGEGNDTLNGGDGSDLVQGGAGDDLMADWWGDDTLDGGEGIDTVDLSPSGTAVVANLAAGTSTGAISGTNNLVHIENLVGGFQDDALTGDAGNNALSGSAGADTLRGGAGDDTLAGGSGTTDRALYAGNFADYLFTVSDGLHVTDKVPGRDGSDRVAEVEYFQFADTVKTIAELGGAVPGIFGTSGADSLSGDAGPDTIDGGGGDDRIAGFGGDNLLIGGEGNDSIGGWLGNDTAVYRGSLAEYTIGYEYLMNSYVVTDSVAGRDGRDELTDVELLQFADGTRALADLSLRIEGDDGDNTRYGTMGGDRIEVYGGNDGVYAQEGNDVVDGGSGNDYLLGEQGNDVLIGGTGDDQLFGGDGDDTLEGGEGEDWLDASTGNDLMVASTGHDTLEGGDGIDAIRIDAPSIGFLLSITPNGGLTFADLYVTGNPDHSAHLVDMERVQFSDVSVAMDIGGSAGLAATYVGAVAGDEGVHDPAWMGLALKFTDAGWSGQAIMDLAANAVFGGWSDAQFASQVFTNLFDAPAPQEEIDYIVGLLEFGYTRGDILYAVAISGENYRHVDIVGLAETGVPYLPM